MTVLQNPRLPGSLLRAVMLVVGTGLLAVQAGPPAAATAAPAAPAPQLRIDVADGRASAVAGDVITYTVSVQNLGTTAVTGLLVSQSVPTGLVFESADSKGVAKSGSVSWKLDLEVNRTVTFHTTMTVVTTPPELLRLATVACATLPATSSPIVCASDSDQLPAGAAAAVVARPAAPASNAKWWYLGGGAAVLVLAGALTLAVVRRRRVGAIG